MHLDNVDLRWRWQIADFTRNSSSKMMALSDYGEKNMMSSTIPIQQAVFYQGTYLLTTSPFESLVQYIL